MSCAVVNYILCLGTASNMCGHMIHRLFSCDSIFGKLNHPEISIHCSSNQCIQGSSLFCIVICIVWTMLMLTRCMDGIVLQI